MARLVLSSISSNPSRLSLYPSFFSIPSSSSSSRFPFRPLSSHSLLSPPARCRAAATPPPPPPPPPGDDPTQLHGAGLATSLSKVKDRVQIFFAVLFWMSLFFWASAWDERNRPNKGSRRRR